MTRRSGAHAQYRLRRAANGSLTDQQSRDIRSSEYSQKVLLVGLPHNSLVKKFRPDFMSLPRGTKIDVRKVRYPVVHHAFARLHVIQTEYDPDAVIVWWDGFMPSNEITNLYPYQRINKIPGMDVICYKNTFFHALSRMKTAFPSFYNFFPRTFQLPFQFSEFQREHLRLSSKATPVTWIVKPRSGCCGNGIRLVQNSFDVANQTQLAVIQRYVSPFLISGFKFDFRFYILISALEPFTVHLYREGLARFCTHEYAPPTRETLGDRFCHLTNTAVNVANTQNSRVILELATSVIERISPDGQRRRALWNRIRQVVLLSIVAQYSNILQNISLVAPEARRERRSQPQRDLDDMHRYFHILGIDIMLNDRCEPVVLELNDRPSMCVTYDIEHGLKSQLVFDSLNLVTVDGTDAGDAARPGGWEKLFPTDDGSLFGQAVQAVLDKSNQGPRPSANRLLVRRLGYVPSTHHSITTYRKSPTLPRLHQ
jgi:hypothetical protein